MPNETKKRFLNKVVGVPFTKAASKDKDGTILVTGKFTTDEKDIAGDIITRGATERATPAYRQWGNIRLMHEPRPVGKVEAMGTEDGLEWNEVTIKVVDVDTVRLVEQGVLKALSIGAYVDYDDIDFLQDGGVIINDYKLVEISLVDHPANYGATLDLALSAEHAVGDLVGQHGLSHAASAFLKYLTEETEMTDTINKTVEEELPVVDAGVAEETAVEEEVVDVEKSLDLDIETEEDVVDEVVDEEVIEEDDVIVEDEVDEVVTEEIEAIDLSAIAELTVAVKALTAELQRSMFSQEVVEEEVVDEVEATEEPSAEDVHVEEDEDTIEDEAPIVEHLAAVPNVETEPADEDAQKVERTLVSALEKRFQIG